MMWAILPYTMVQREALAHGEFPLWNRYNTIGEPLWGQAQTFFLDPFHLASLAIPDPSVAMDLRFVVGRMVFAIGSGLAVAVVTGNGLAAVLVALLAPFVGHFTARFNHPAYFSIVYAPWILFAYARLGARHRPAIGRGRRLLALATWLQLVGSTPKEGLIALVAAHAAGMLGLLVAPGAWKDKLGRVDFALLGGITAMLARRAALVGVPRHAQPLVDAVRHAERAVRGVAHTVGYVLGGAAPGSFSPAASTLAVMAALCAFGYPARLLRSGVGLGALLACAGIGAVAYGMVPAELAAEAAAAPQHPSHRQLVPGGEPGAAAPGGRRRHRRLRWTKRLTVRRCGWPCGVAAATVLCASVVPGSAFQMTTIVGMAAVIGAAVALLILPVVTGRLRPSGALAWLLAAMTALFTNGLQLETGVGAVDALLIQPRPRADIDAVTPALASLPRGG